jgi:hypothetical protein
MKATLIVALCAALALPLAAQTGDQTPADADQAAGGDGTLPAGWTLRPDGKADAGDAKIVTMGKGLHVTTGPAVILYRDGTGGSGPFHTLATFTQTKPAAHPEGYGLFFAGDGLDGEGQAYTYFLVRQDGSYLVKRRDGAKTSDVSKGWTPHPAVKKPDAKGTATNLLEVDNKTDPAKVTFKVNGQGVYTADAKEMAVDGVVGIRVNHNLDVHVEGFDVHR